VKLRFVDIEFEGSPEEFKRAGLDEQIVHRLARQHGASAQETNGSQLAARHDPSAPDEGAIGPGSSFAVGDKVEAKWPEDGNYYSAFLRTLNKAEGIATVQWLDGGAEEEVALADLKPWINIAAPLLTRALTRIALSDNQRALLHAVTEASDEKGITSEELAKKIGLTARELSGVWGTLGRRLANTPGWPSQRYPWHREWEGHQYRYTPEPVLRDVLASGAV